MTDSTMLAVVIGLIVGVAFIAVFGLIFIHAPLIDNIGVHHDRGKNRQIVDIILRDSKVTDLLKNHNVALIHISANTRFDNCSFAPPARVIMELDNEFLFLSVDYINGRVVGAMMQVKGESTPIFSRPFDMANNTREFKEQIVNGTVTIAPYDSSYVQFDVPNCVLEAKVMGTVEARGGNDNEIYVYFMPANTYNDWRNGGNLGYYAGTGKTSLADIDFDLPFNQNAYLVFDNTFSNSTKTVIADIQLSYKK